MDRVSHDQSRHAPALKPAAADEALASDAVRLLYGAAFLPVPRGTPHPQLTIFSTPLASLATFLWGGLDAAVEDRTELPGAYNFVRAKSEPPEPGDPAPQLQWRIEDLGPAIKNTRGQVLTLIVDKISRPGED